MHRKYDLFEKFPDGSSLWRAWVLGLESTRHHLRELAKRSQNRFYAMNIASGKIVRCNPNHGGSGLSAPRRIDSRSRSATA